MCASSGSIVAPWVARVSTKCGVRMLKADARWSMCGPRGSRECGGTVNSPLFLCPTPFSAIHTYIRIPGVCELSMVKQRFVMLCVPKVCLISGLVWISYWFIFCK